MNTYRKLQDGSWGVKVPFGKPGEEVQVTLKSGATKTEVLDKLVASYPDGWVFTIKPKARELGNAQVGDLSGVMALFAKAKQHLKYPAIVMSVPAEGSDFALRINVAGEKAKVPGSLNVIKFEKRIEGRERGARPQWFGRIHQDGRFDKTSAASDAIVERLTAFAKNPAAIAAEHGRLTGRCCFCNAALKDERSTAVGYGATCAKHFGVPWGARPNGFAENAYSKEEGFNDRVDDL